LSGVTQNVLPCEVWRTAKFCRSDVSHISMAVSVIT
jgi:hypothetical protein